MSPRRPLASSLLLLAATAAGCSGGGSGGGAAGSTVAPIVSAPSASVPVPPGPAPVTATPPVATTPPAPATPRRVSKPPVVWDRSPNQSSRSGTKIDTIVIHTTEGKYMGAVSWFKNPTAQASAHYVINESGSEIRQMVADDQKAWTETYYNARALGIECAGYSGKASTWTKGNLDALYDLVAWLCQEHGVQVAHPSGNAYDFPGDRYTGTGLVAHGQIQPWDRTDPGPYFDWNALIQNVNARLGRTGSAAPAATPAPPAATHPVLRQGSNGPDVVDLQKALEKKGFSPGAIDGDFGPATLQAVLAFQRSRQLTPDGIVGPATWTELLR